MPISPIQRRRRLGILCALCVGLVLTSTLALGNPEDLQPDPGCGGMPMPEPATWMSLGALLAVCLFAALRQKRNISEAP